MNDEHTGKGIPIAGAVVGGSAAVVLAYYYLYGETMYLEFYLPPMCFAVWGVPALLGAAIGVLVGGAIEIVITNRKGD